MGQNIKRGIWCSLILRIMGWGVLLCIFISIITLYRSEHVQERRYNEALNTYSLDLQKYNKAFSDYEDSLHDYYDDVVNACGISSSGSLLVDVTISTEKTNTEHIGNEISYKYEINSQSVHNGGQAYIYLFNKNTIFSEIRDDDPSSDDVGDANDELIFSPSQLNNGTSVAQNVSVHESYGRDAGNTATYSVVFTIKLHNRINTQSIGKEPVYPQIAKPAKPELSQDKLNWYIVLAEDWFTKTCVIILACIFAFLTIRKSLTDVKEFKTRIKEEAAKKAAYEKERKEFLEAIQGKSLLELANVPRNITFNNEGLPVDASSGTKYGCFTVYYTNSGTCYHTKRGCSSAKNEMHLISAINRRYMPCSRCVKEKASIPQWYTDYQELLKKKKRLDL